MDGITSSGAGWIDALDDVSTGTAGGYTYKIPSGDYGWVSNPGSSSSIVCVNTSDLIPTDCPSGSTPITIAPTYPKIGASSHLSQTSTFANRFETLLSLFLLSIALAGLGNVLSGVRPEWNMILKRPARIIRTPDPSSESDCYQFFRCSQHIGS